MDKDLRQLKSALGQPSPQGGASEAGVWRLGQRVTAGLLQTALTVVAVASGFAIADGNPAGMSVAVAAERNRVRWTPKQDRGNAKGTLSGGRRGQESSVCGPDESATRLTLLVPEGRENLVTTQVRPTLSWQVVTQKPTSMQLILSDMTQPTPIYTQTLEAAATGMVNVTLPETVSLEEDTRYRWTVIANCPDGQKSEIYARSFIRKTSGESLEQQLSQQSAVSQAAVFAENGIWYDALARLINAPQSDGENSKAALANLLDQGVPGFELVEGSTEQ